MLVFFVLCKFISKCVVQVIAIGLFSFCSRQSNQIFSSNIGYRAQEMCVCVSCPCAQDLLAVEADDAILKQFFMYKKASVIWPNGHSISYKFVCLFNCNCLARPNAHITSQGQFVISFRISVRLYNVSAYSLNFPFVPHSTNEIGMGHTFGTCHFMHDRVLTQ